MTNMILASDNHAMAAPDAFIDRIIEAAAPDKAQTWRKLRTGLSISFHPIEDRKGVTLRARGRRVEFDPKTMTWIWLLGFAGWRAFSLHGPLIFFSGLSGRALDDLRTEDPGFNNVESDYEAVLYAVRDLPELDSVDEAQAHWPDGIPPVQIDKTGFDVEQQAAFDLTMIATAYMLLHEVRHVVFNAAEDAGARPNPSDEELECDAFARRFILEGAANFAVSRDVPVDEVVAKRAAGIALGAYALYGFTPAAGRDGTADYPPIADRLDALIPDVSLPADHWFWNFANGLLTAIIVSRDRTAPLPEPDRKGADLAWALVERIRTR